MRYRSRLVLMLALIVVSSLRTELPKVVTPVAAAVETRAPTPTPLLSAPLKVSDLPRSELSTREVHVPIPVAATPTPVPTPTVPPKPKLIVSSHILAYPLPAKAHINTYFSSRHRAIDLNAKCGTPVLASYPGTITFAGWATNGGGNVITLEASNGLMLSYDHLSAFLVVKGALVIAGQPIGAVGATGIATGCHLHFGVMSKGRWVNPLLYL